MSNYTNFRDFKTFNSVFLLTIPIWLWMANGFVWEKSISQFANTSPLAFGILMTMSWMTIFIDGFVERHRWYNWVCGLALFGVTVFINTLFPLLHYGFAIVFFILPSIMMLYFSFKEKKRLVKIILRLSSNVVIFAGLGHFVFHLYSILVLEWIGMFPMSAMLFYIIRFNKGLINKNK
tara:strand:- start:164 stop:697 length:534 start_codon:yes stop_codon:yes gene_type:complete